MIEQAAPSTADTVPSAGEKRMRRRGIALFIAALVTAAGLAEYVWKSLGQDITAVAGGLLTIAAVLSAASIVYWRWSRAWQSSRQGRLVNRPKWVTHLFGIGLFVFPLEWAKKTVLFSVSQPIDIVWSPRIALVAGLAVCSLGLMYVITRGLTRLEERALAQARAT